MLCRNPKCSGAGSSWGLGWLDKARAQNRVCGSRSAPSSENTMQATNVNKNAISYFLATLKKLEIVILILTISINNSKILEHVINVLEKKKFPNSVLKIVTRDLKILTKYGSYYTYCSAIYIFCCGKYSYHKIVHFNHF